MQRRGQYHHYIQPVSLPYEPTFTLTQHKQDQLAEIVKVIREIADPVKIILFGSHATDNWVEGEYEEGWATYSYISDYDKV